MGIAQDGGRTDANADHPRVERRLDTGSGILENHAFLRCAADRDRRFEEHLRIGFGITDAVAINHSIELITKPDSLEDQRCVLAGGTKRDLDTPSTNCAEKPFGSGENLLRVDLADVVKIP